MTHPDHAARGQLAEKIEQMPLLLRHLDLKGCVVSADAAHAQTHTAQVIIERGGAYVLCVKGDQSAARLAGIARSHWSVEPERSGDRQRRAACAARRVREANQNALHWRLECSGARIRAAPAPARPPSTPTTSPPCSHTLLADR